MGRWDATIGGRRWLLGLLGVLAIVVPAACDSPTLPLPPPADPVVSVASDTLCTGERYADVQAGSGSAIPGAIIMAFNHNTDTGTIIVAGPSGDYHLKLPVDFSQAGRNVIDIWQRDAHGDSAPVTHLVSGP